MMFTSSFSRSRRRCLTKRLHHGQAYRFADLVQHHERGFVINGEIAGELKGAVALSTIYETAMAARMSRTASLRLAKIVPEVILNCL